MHIGSGVAKRRPSDVGKFRTAAIFWSIGTLLILASIPWNRALLPLVRSGRIAGLAHITGGGLIENIPRVLPENCHAVLSAGNWPMPRLFALLSEGGELEPAEMVRTFNCGIGMVVIVPGADADAVARELEGAGETVHRIGAVVGGPRGCTVEGPAGWGSDEDWTVTHHA